MMSCDYHMGSCDYHMGLLGPKWNSYCVLKASCCLFVSVRPALAVVAPLKLSLYLGCACPLDSTMSCIS